MEDLTVQAVKMALNEKKNEYQEEVEDNIALSYEESKVCSDDKGFIEFCKSFISEVETFSGEISKIPVPSNYKNTISDIANLISYIGAGLESLNTIPESILNCSKKAFEELIGEFNPIKANYERSLVSCNDFIFKAEDAERDYSIYCRRLSELVMPPADVIHLTNYYSQKQELESLKKKALARKKTNLRNAKGVIDNQITSSISRMKEILDKGLKKA